MEIFQIITELCFTITAVLAGGAFIIILLKYILASVVDSTKTLNMLITALDNRVKTINNEIVRLDSLAVSLTHLTLPSISSVSISISLGSY